MKLKLLISLIILAIAAPALPALATGVETSNPVLLTLAKGKSYRPKTVRVKAHWTKDGKYIPTHYRSTPKR